MLQLLVPIYYDPRSVITLLEPKKERKKRKTYQTLADFANEKRTFFLLVLVVLARIIRRFGPDAYISQDPFEVFNVPGRFERVGNGGWFHL